MGELGCREFLTRAGCGVGGTASAAFIEAQLCAVRGTGRARNG